ncbi:DNA helicase, partial [Tanacetum coccineum]
DLFYFRMLLCHQKGCKSPDEVRIVNGQMLPTFRVACEALDFGLQSPPQHLLKDLQNKLLMEEKNYKRDLLKQDAAQSVPKLNSDKKNIYDLIIGASLSKQQELLLFYGHGGTGKTFLWKTIISSLRSEGKIVLAVASSGIASRLLSARRTTHSRFKLPLELTDDFSTSVSKTHNSLLSASHLDFCRRSLLQASHLDFSLFVFRISSPEILCDMILSQEG